MTEMKNQVVVFKERRVFSPLFLFVSGIFVSVDLLITV